MAVILERTFPRTLDELVADLAMQKARKSRPGLSMTGQAGAQPTRGGQCGGKVWQRL